MKKKNKPRPFSKELKLLSDAYTDAIMLADSESKIIKIRRNYDFKTKSIYECSNAYKIVKKMKLKNEDKILELITAAVQAYLKAQGFSDFQRINRLYKTKLKAYVNIAQL